ncbi:MAG: hypothetical protein NC420_02150 [Eubacterium sp.]|nr:hypothetical protein [Eubacterium sp.]MCM1214874.1 hypothetical protein [Lachnospiraceae bacterium]MCM1303501.1 hypothetical protein [Butyrivibrio sp.]MCM1342735.1 hypothetical protein [Muribaculaceae bacterium]MCM1238950.1 hypothetical protein [Lachnospiraceae bacterium]
MNDKDYMDMLWNYFELHSGQRMQLMNFFIVLESLMVAGLISLLSAENNLSIWECGICAGMIFFAAIFYGLDRRTKKMIQLCESSIKMLERRNNGTRGPVEEWVGIFSKEEYYTKNEKIKYTYSKLFGIQYAFFAIIAIAMLIFICCLNK